MIEFDSPDCFVATGTALLLSGLAAAGTTAYAATKQSGTAQQTAADQIAANNKAAELQAKSSADALDFSKQQAAQEQGNFVTTQNANYAQYARSQGLLAPYQKAGAGAISTLGQMMGLPDVHLPDLPPPPKYGGQDGGSGGGGNGGAPPTIDPSKDIAPQLSAYFKSRGASDAEVPYWTQKWDEFGKQDPEYFGRRVADADIFG